MLLAMLLLSINAYNQCDPITNTIAAPIVACPANDPNVIENVVAPVSNCNMISNGEFDEVTNNEPDDWSNFSQGGSAASDISIDTNSELSGTNSLFVEQISAGTAAWQTKTRQNPIPLTAGTQYDFSLKLRLLLTET